MNDWQNDLNRRQAADAAANKIAAEIANQKNADRKHILRIEIAKATDRRVKAELEALLNDIERTEKTRKIALISIVIVAFIVFGGFAFTHFSNDQNNISAVNSSSAIVSNSTDIQTSSTMNTTSSVSKNSTVSSDQTTTDSSLIDTKNLTTDQIKEWVSAVVEAGGVTNNFKVDIDTKDGYAYATVTNTDAQVDSMGTYRVNEKGELEEDGFYYEKLGAWIVVSPSYMDVSNIPDINNVQSQQINPISNKFLVTNFDSAVDWLKEHKENWSYSNKNSETVVITGVNESLTDLRNDELGSYYTVVVNTNDDDGGITGSTKQFKVYTNGVIQQRAGMHDFYTIYTGS